MTILKSKILLKKQMNQNLMKHYHNKNLYLIKMFIKYECNIKFHYRKEIFVSVDL